LGHRDKQLNLSIGSLFYYFNCNSANSVW